MPAGGFSGGEVCFPDLEVRDAVFFVQRSWGILRIHLGERTGVVFYPDGGLMDLEVFSLRTI